MTTILPSKPASTFVITGIFVMSLVFTGCSEHSILGPDDQVGVSGTAVTETTVDNREARHNDAEGGIHADKNGENATTYGGDHNL